MENSSGQDRKWKSGYWGSFYAADYIITIELQVKWLDKPELQVEKNADKSGKTYKLGDIITYTLGCDSAD